MTKHERDKLRWRMRQIIADMLSTGGRVTTAQIFDRMFEEMPDLMEAQRDQLFRVAMMSMIREMLKESMRREDKQELMEVSLFGNEAPGLAIPKCIALPSKSDRREMVWVPTLQATLNELSAHVQYLQEGARADLAKAQKLRAFRDFIIALAPHDDPDVPISELLAGLREAATA